MDLPELPDALNQTGLNYYNSLTKLGLDPEALLWVYNTSEKQFHLWLVWSGLDRYGPLAISKLLFQAYNASALPKEIDPFSVYVTGADHFISQMVVGMKDAYPKVLENDAFQKFAIRHTSIGGENTHYTTYRWAYHFQNKRNNLKKVNRDWKSFNANVSALAA